jgi:hypothetical protein
MKYLPILLLALLAACHRSPEQIKFGNEISLAHPQIVGHTPDGQNIYHSTIRVVGNSYDQELFFVGTTVTDNTRETTGKTNVPKVMATIHSTSEPDTVVLDGEHYDAAEVRAALARDEDQRRKQEGNK